VLGAIAFTAVLAPASPPPVRQAFDLAVPCPPVLLDVARERQLVYELHLTNFSSRLLSLDRLAIVDAATEEVLGAYEGAALGRLLNRAGVAAPTADSRIVPSGARIIAYLNLPLRSRSAPRAVKHRIDFEIVSDALREPSQVVGQDVAIDARPLLQLTPPLRGGPWVAVYDPAMERGHRRVFYAVGGAARLPGRFAIDWFKLDDTGRAVRNNGARVSDYLGYGAEVLAVADAVVAATRDDVAETETVAGHQNVSIGDATGNYIALDLGHGRYAFYEHLQPGLLVKPGEHVRRGQVIARLGYTGQTTGPHLHFHVADANSPLGAEGIPYLLTSFEPVGSYDSIEAVFGNHRWRSFASDSRVQDAMFPSPNMVVRFPDGH